MTQYEQRNRAFLTDLFAGPFHGHAILMSPPLGPDHGLGDYAVSDRPVTDWVPGLVENYRQQVRCLDEIGDDRVPYLNLATNTGVFASAFGCPLHVYDDRLTTNACALPAVQTAEEADALPQPQLEDSRALMRYFDLASALQQELGPDVPIGVPDIQSPFDIAALVWEKEAFYYAIMDTPDAVHRLVGKCYRLLTDFLDRFLREIPAGNLCHYPPAWAPASLGMWLSEDEAGALSCAMFEEFCLPTLMGLSARYGGLFMHCCANANHQYGAFAKIPNLRGLNRCFLDPGAQPLASAIPVFSGTTVFLQVTCEADVYQYLDIAQPDTRYLFNVSASSLDDAKAIFARLRERCPRTEPATA